MGYNNKPIIRYGRTFVQDAGSLPSVPVEATTSFKELRELTSAHSRNSGAHELIKPQNPFESSNMCVGGLSIYLKRALFIFDACMSIFGGCVHMWLSSRNYRRNMSSTCPRNWSHEHLEPEIQSHDGNCLYMNAKGSQRVLFSG